MEGVDFFKTYAPAVLWPIIHLLLTLSVIGDLKTQQVDHVNTFAQAEVDDNIYITLPISGDTMRR